MDAIAPGRRASRPGCAGSYGRRGRSGHYRFDHRTAHARRRQVHHLRQQTGKVGFANYCLADFVAPKLSGKADYIGAFAVTGIINAFLFKIAPYIRLDQDNQVLILFSSFLVAFLVIAVPLGVMAAIYISEIAPQRVREILKSVIELLAGLPSVVLGFFGMVIVAPWLQETFDLPTGLNIINASVILAIMAIPTISSISEDALYAVPREFKEASYALGATKFETIAQVIVPAALSGISTAVMLGMARAVGETMVVLMVAGGAAAIPESLFDPVRPMPASIAAEMGETPYGSAHYQALFAIGMVLFFLTLAFNLIADYVSHKFRQTGSATL